MTEFVGLDIGRRSVKLVGITKAGKAIRLTDFAKTDLPTLESEEARPEAVVESVEKLFTEKNLSKNRVVLSHHSHDTCLKVLSLPFTKPQEIEKTIYFEAESLLPYQTEEVIIEYRKIKETDGKSQLLIVAVHKDTLRRELEILEECGIDPVAVELDAFGLYRVVTKTRHFQQGETLLILDLGALSAKIMLIEAGRIKFLRSLRIGGDDITHDIAEKLSLSFAKAEALKRDFPGLNEGFSRPEDEVVSNAFEAYLDKIVNEIKRSLFAANLEEKPKCVLITGGVCKVKGLSIRLQKSLALPAEPLDLKGVFEAELSEEEMEALETFGAPALGLALLQIEEDPFSIGFRQGEFRYKKKFERLKCPLLVTIILLFILFSAAALNFQNRTARMKRRYQEASAEIRAVWQETFPESALPYDVASRLEAHLTLLKGGSAVEEEIPRYHSALDALRQVISEIPESEEFSASEIHADQQGIRIKAETSSYSAAEKIAEAVDHSENLQASAKDLRPAPDNKIAFLLDVKFEGKEDVRR